MLRIGIKDKTLCLENNGKNFFVVEAPSIVLASKQKNFKYEKPFQSKFSPLSRNSIDFQFSYFSVVLSGNLAFSEHQAEISMNIKNVSDSSVSLLRINYLDCQITAAKCHINFEDISMPADSWLHQEQNGCHIAHKRWAFLNDPIHRQKNWHYSEDAAVLDWLESGESLVMGFTGPGCAFGEIAIKQTETSRYSLLASAMMEEVLLPPGKTKTLDSFFLFAGNMQEGFREWSKLCVEQMGARASLAPLQGYCSWYNHEKDVKEADILAAVDSFNKFSQKPYVIQLDDGYQIMPGLWQPNYKFPNFYQLAQTIKEHGGIPGIWIAPTAIHKNHPILKHHPEIVQRFGCKNTPGALSNWWWCCSETPNKYNTWFLDPDHPIAKAMMTQCIRSMIEAGFKYLKLDFVHNICAARNNRNPYKTSFENLRDLFALFREAAGDEVFLCACVGGTGRYALGYVDSQRIGGDVTDDFSHVEYAIHDSLFKLIKVQGWWQPDPDVFYMRKQNNRLTFNENFVLTGTLSLMGGIFFTSDLPEEWDSDAKHIVDQLWNQQERNQPEKIELSFNSYGQISCAWFFYKNSLKLAVYNWKKEKQSITVSVPELWDRPNRVIPSNNSWRLDGTQLCCTLDEHSMQIFSFNRSCL